MTFMEIAFYIVIAIVGIIAIKIYFKFDINEWLKVRRETQKIKLQNICPHVSIEKRGDNFLITGLVVSPPGTIAWQCQRCGFVSYAGTPEEEMEYWKNNPKELARLQESTNKQIKKMGYL